MPKNNKKSKGEKIHEQRFFASERAVKKNPRFHFSRGLTIFFSLSSVL